MQRTVRFLKAALVTLLCLAILTFCLYGGLPVEKGRYVPQQPDSQLLDDLLADKAPAFIPELVSVVEIKHSGYILNRSDSIIALDMEGVRDEELELKHRIFPSFRDALDEILPDEERYSPYADQPVLPSIDMLDAFTKYTDDRLVAAVDRYVSTGSQIYSGGKQGLLKALANELLRQPPARSRDEAAAYLAAAYILGGGEIQGNWSNLSTLIADETARFESGPFNAKPVGLFAEDEQLAAIFKRDRYLQQPFGGAIWGARERGPNSYPLRPIEPMLRIAEMLQANPDMLAAYHQFRILAERISNPGANLHLEDLLNHQQLFTNPQALSAALVSSPATQRAREYGNVNEDTLGIAFWPFSTSPENRLFARIYRTGELPPSSTMDDLTSAIKAGDVDLTPTASSGWYDYQLHALETLLVPEYAHESDKLLLTARYKKRLKKAFEAMTTQRRETHIKEMMIIKTKGGPRIPPHPQLTIEPAPTNYLRTARGYRFLLAELEGAFGDELAEIAVDEASTALAELRTAAGVFYGLYLMSCNDIGMVPELAPLELAGIIDPDVQVRNKYQAYGPEDLYCVALLAEDADEVARRLAACEQTTQWLQELPANPALSSDSRVIVPILANETVTEVRYWAVIGVALKRLKAHYAVPPRYLRSSYEYFDQETHKLDAERVLAAMDTKAKRDGIEWEPASKLIPVYVFAELTMGSEPPTREEFRAICDQGATEQEIIAALTKGRGNPLRGIILAAGAAIAVVLALVFLLSFVLRRRALLREG
jgi:hypothetical protein